MNTRNILSIALLSSALVACNDDYNDQFDSFRNTDITGTITREMTLSSADYEKIASAEENVALAEQFAAADTLPSCSPTELAAIGTNHYFLTDTAAQKFIPVLLSTYSNYGDDGSIVSVKYKRLRFKADYLQSNIGSYTVSDDDYITVWGDEVKASYLTPATLKKIPSLLSAAIESPKQDTIVVVNYMYDDVEPSIGGGTSEEEDIEYAPSGDWKQVTVPNYPTGEDWNYIESGDIDLSAYAGKHIQLGFRYTSTTEIAPTWEISDVNICDKDGNGIYEYDLKDAEQYALFTTEGDIPEGLTYVWSQSSTYGAKASAYANKVRYNSDIYLCTPTVSIKSGYSCYFNHALRYFEDDASAMARVYVREMKAKKAPRRAQVAATLGYNASTAYTYSGTAWQQMETDNSQIVVVDPAAYVQAGSTYFNNSKVQIPIYLQASYPYASKGDIYTVIYKSSPSSFAMDDYELGDAGWSISKGTDRTTEKTMKFQRVDGVWTPNASTFYSNTFLGDEGNFTQRGTLPEGLTYVWTNTNNYGWKASAYANKTNNPCKMYLVSPAIDLDGAEAPAMTFDEVYRYINSPETAAGLLKVLVSTDYDESDAESYSTCTWTEMEIPVRASGEDWTFVNVGKIDLTAFKGQTIHVAFFYECTETSAPTWEVKNLEIAEQ